VITSSSVPEVTVTERVAPGAADCERVAPAAGAVEKDRLSERPAAGPVLSEHAARVVTARMAVVASNLDCIEIDSLCLMFDSAARYRGHAAVRAEIPWRAARMGVNTASCEAV
jgi:hypothetical protein